MATATKAGRAWPLVPLRDGNGTVGSPAVAAQSRENLRSGYRLYVACFELVISTLSFFEPDLLHLLWSQFIKTRDEEMREPCPLTGFKAKDFSLKLVAGHRVPPPE